MIGNSLPRIRKKINSFIMNEVGNISKQSLFVTAALLGILAGLLAACSNGSGISPIVSATQAQQVPTYTLMPSSTPTLKPTPTSTPTITNTPQPSLVLDGFTGEIVGMGESGSEMCFEYQGKHEDLEGISLTIDTKVNGEVKETGLSLILNEDGKFCTDGMVDRKYISGVNNGKLEIPKDPTMAIIHASSIDKLIKNNGQEIDLGPFVQEPFIKRIYPSNVKASCIGKAGPSRIMYGGRQVIHTGLDITPKTSSIYPKRLGIPVIPSGGVAIKTWPVGSAGYEMVFFNQKTGYFTVFMHVGNAVEVKGVPGSLWDTIGKEANDITLTIGSKGPYSIEHIHLMVVMFHEGMEDYSLQDITRKIKFIDGRVEYTDNLDYYVNILNPGTGNSLLLEPFENEMGSACK